MKKLRMEKINYLLLIRISQIFHHYPNYIQTLIVRRLYLNSLLIGSLMANNKSLEVQFSLIKVTSNKLGVISYVHVLNCSSTRIILKSIVKMLLKEFLLLENFGKENSLILLNRTMTCKYVCYLSYGPFWILTTIVFCLSSVHNILKYQA